MSGETAKPPKKPLLLLPELLSTKFEEREIIVKPWLRAGGLALFYAPTGHGKTLVMLNLALSIAAGQQFLNQPIPKPKRVLYVDGEMPIDMIQDRLRMMLQSHRWNTCIHENFGYMSHEFLERGIPPLGDPQDDRGRRLIDRQVADFDVLFIDNVSSLMGYGIENDAESWSKTNEWLLSLRRRGRAVIVVHHAGKVDSRGNYSQRGTSRRIDQLDTMVQLVKTKDKTQGEHSMQIHWLYEKHRSFLPKPVEGFDVQIDFGLNAAGEETSCRLSMLDDAIVRSEVDEVLALQASGMTLRQIEKEVGKSRSTLSRMLKKSHVSSPEA